MSSNIEHPATAEGSLKKNWELEELSWHQFNRQLVPDRLKHVVFTTALVESRADMYADYLLSVFSTRPQWSDQVRRWNLEERQHGQSLRRWSEMVDPDFDFSSLFEKYLAQVAYHEKTGQSVRGSIKDELISRCTVEALASGYYAALHDAIEEPLLQEICRRLRQDEARHFSMFFAFLAEEGGVDAGYCMRAAFVCLKRIMELDDEQIIYAAVCATRDEPRIETSRLSAWSRYFAELMGTYKLAHTQYISGMLLRIFGLSGETYLHRVLSVILFVLVKSKYLLTRLLSDSTQLLTRKIPPARLSS